MTQHRQGPSDEQLEGSVASLLLVGVVLATAIVLAGGILYLEHPLQGAPAYHPFIATEPALRSLPGTWRGMLHGSLHDRARPIIQLGLMVLILTPIARVALCLLGFARQRDKLYAIISAIVLLILIYSLAHPV